MPGPAQRNRYVDFLRLLAIVVVVVGHWLATTIVIVDGYPVGESALGVVGYLRWLTLLLQIMPMFFLAGGFAAAASWPSWRVRGGHWAGWIYVRFVRLLRPTTWFVGLLAAGTAAAALLGAPPQVLAQAGWAVALQLWFLPVYLLLLLLAAPLWAAWQHFGWRLLAAAVAGVAGVDLLTRGAGIAVAGWANYLLAPAAGFVLGMAWYGGALADRRLRLALLVGGTALLLALIAFLGYPPWMVGIPGEPPANTSPPNLALMAYAAAQIGLVLLLEAPMRRYLQRPRLWAVVVGGNRVVMSIYLWHMVPVLVVGFVIAATGLPTGPTAGTAAWWLARIVWIGVLGMLLAGLVAVVGRFERPAVPRPQLRGTLASLLLVASAGLTGFALSRLALGGFAPGGEHVAVAPLLLYAVGVLALWLPGSSAADSRHRGGSDQLR